MYMGNIFFFLLVIGLGLLAVAGGYKLGSLIGKALGSKKVFWFVNAVVFFLVVVMTTVCYAFGVPEFMAIGVALAGGIFAGLKEGFGNPGGLWDVHDEFFGLDEFRKLKGTQEYPDEEAKKRELISVPGEPSQKSSSKSKKK